MEGCPLGSRQPDEQEFNLREWHLRARISRENTNSRRYSASYIRSFREEYSRSFRSNFTISSTASSPGYNLKDEIDPSTYSFTTALKALQAKSGYVWEYASPDQGFLLSSKWDEAERFISNPLSGEVPMECLSAKTLSGRSFRGFMASRVTMSAPLVFSSQHQHKRTLNNSTNNPLISTPVLVIKEPSAIQPDFPIHEEDVMGRKTRDTGTQSNPQEGEEEGGSRSPSPTSTPSIKERSLRRSEETEDCDTQNSSSSIKLKPVVDEVDVMKVTIGEEETKRRNKEGEKKMMKKNRRGQLCICKQSGGCLLLSWRSLWMKKRQREKHKIPSSHTQTITTTMSKIQLDKSNTKMVTK